jgi:hypothetical protein
LEGDKQRDRRETEQKEGVRQRGKLREIERLSPREREWCSRREREPETRLWRTRAEPVNTQNLERIFRGGRDGPAVYVERGWC